MLQFYGILTVRKRFGCGALSGEHFLTSLHIKVPKGKMYGTLNVSHVITVLTLKGATPKNKILDPLI